MPLVPSFHLVGSGTRPAADRIIYADGSAGDDFRSGVDLELSHWIPNTTPDRWRADSSTETCFRFADDPDGEFDLAVNNHADVDGTMSLFVLTHTEFAVEHRDAIIGAAEVGDFRAWPTRAACRLAQEIELHLHATENDDLAERYRGAFAVARGVLDGTHPEAPSVEPLWAAMQRSAEALVDGTISTTVVDERLVSFVHPRTDVAQVGPQLDVHVMGPMNADAVGLPHGRNRDHAQQIQLVSIPTDAGWFHDVWYPGYSWAETPHRWTPPGLRSTGTSLVLVVDHPPLAAAVAALDALDRAPGRWALAERLTPFDALSARAFPIVVSHVGDDDAPAPSTLDADTVARQLAGVWV